MRLEANRKRIAFILAIGMLGIGFLFFTMNHSGIPFVSWRQVWSIGIYSGAGLRDLSPVGAIDFPVLTAHDVSDRSATMVADPFMIQIDSTWYMFFEIMDHGSGHADIGLATSDDGLIWKYEQVVLDEPFHLSYPYVFGDGTDIYMVPESTMDRTVNLYRAVDFPTSWTLDSTLLEGRYDDASILHYENAWWIFAGQGDGNLLLFLSGDLRGPYREHPMSPIVRNDRNKARPAGRILYSQDQLIRFAQDGEPAYGYQVWAFEITRLSDTDYREQELAGRVVGPSGRGWNRDGMHHVDAHWVAESQQWLACVDGWKRRVRFDLLP